MQLDVGNEPYLSRPSAYLLATFSITSCRENTAMVKSDFVSEIWIFVQWKSDRQTDRQTDRKRRIRAHRAICTGGLNNCLEYSNTLKFYAEHIKTESLTVSRLFL